MPPPYNNFELAQAFHERFLREHPSGESTYSQVVLDLSATALTTRGDALATLSLGTDAIAEILDRRDHPLWQIAHGSWSLYNDPEQADETAREVVTRLVQRGLSERRVMQFLEDETPISLYHYLRISSEPMRPDILYATSEPEFVGRMPIRQDLQILPSRETPPVEYQWVSLVSQPLDPHAWLRPATPDIPEAEVEQAEDPPSVWEHLADDDLV